MLNFFDVEIESFVVFSRQQKAAERREGEDKVRGFFERPLVNLLELLYDTDTDVLTILTLGRIIWLWYTTNGPLDNRLIDDNNKKHNFRYIDDEIDIEVTKKP